MFTDNYMQTKLVTVMEGFKNKSRIRETKNLSTDADSRTDTILERLRDNFFIFLFLKLNHATYKKNKYIYIYIFR